MPPDLSCYFLDHALDGDDLRFAELTLTGPWARFKTGARNLRQIRVPAVLPLPEPGGDHLESRETRARHVRRNLRHAGISGDAGRQVAWIMPRDPDWDAVFRSAIRDETGFGPLVAQRWYLRDGLWVRCGLRLIDTDMLLRGIETT